MSLPPQKVAALHLYAFSATTLSMEIKTMVLIATTTTAARLA